MSTDSLIAFLLQKLQNTPQVAQGSTTTNVTNTNVSVFANLSKAEIQTLIDTNKNGVVDTHDIDAAGSIFSKYKVTGTTDDLTKFLTNSGVEIKNTADIKTDDVNKMSDFTLFQMVNNDLDDSITFEEFKNNFASQLHTLLGFSDDTNISQDNLRKIFNELNEGDEAADKDSKASLDLKEFGKFDTDGDGSISKVEMENFFKSRNIKTDEPLTTNKPEEKDPKTPASTEQAPAADGGGGGGSNGGGGTGGTPVAASGNQPGGNQPPAQPKDLNEFAADSTAATNKEKIADLNSNIIPAINDEIGKQTQALDDKLGEVEDLQKDKDGLTTRYNGNEEQINACQKSITDQAGIIQTQDGIINDKNNEISSLQSQLSGIKDAPAGASSDAQKDVSEQRDAIKKQIEAAEAARDAAQRAKDAAQMVKTAEETKLNGTLIPEKNALLDEISSILPEGSELKPEISNYKTQLSIAQSKISEANSNLHKYEEAVEVEQGTNSKDTTQTLTGKTEDTSDTEQPAPKVDENKADELAKKVYDALYGENSTGTKDVSELLAAEDLNLTEADYDLILSKFNKLAVNNNKVKPEYLQTIKNPEVSKTQVPAQGGSGNETQSTDEELTKSIRTDLDNAYGPDVSTDAISAVSTAKEDLTYILDKGLATSEQLQEINKLLKDIRENKDNASYSNAVKLQQLVFEIKKGQK